MPGWQDEEMTVGKIHPEGAQVEMPRYRNELLAPLGSAGHEMN